jgi:AraC family transcriptional regulator of adaptative response/methylated-DNA-[protein]-cysteine methyltransferase
MLADKVQREFYQALLEKNIEYEGVFYVGVLSTGIFCRPTCSARKPKFENCKFYRTAEEALLASFRPCMRCHPLSNPDNILRVVSTLITAIELTPEKKMEQC